ncbi:MAG: radical SAM protein [Thermodesulfobacterium sp.]|nr:radical SAM protein [Thermodesulfobacterium sp.]
MDPFHPELPKKPKRRNFGIGHFYKEFIPKPIYFNDVPRRFYRYGIPVNILKKTLKHLKFKAILLTCTMTYWYPGLLALLEFLTTRYPKTPIYIGGIYAKLCYKHLKKQTETYFSDYPIYIVNENHNKFLKEIKNKYQPSGEPYSYEYPIFDLQNSIPYVVIMTSYGCPFNCPYCASKKLYPEFKIRNPEDVSKEILFWHKNYGVVDFAFYDDALLFNFDSHLAVILEKVLSHNLNLRFHTPNAVHARFITKDVAQLLKMAGFKTIRIGLERVENRFDNKVSIDEFLQAVSYLKSAGFKENELGAYLLYGIPGENFEEVKRSLLFLEKHKVPPHLAEFSPIPGTPFFELAKQYSRYSLEEDPIFHNNTVFPALKNPNWEEIEELKTLARKIRHSICD